MRRILAGGLAVLVQASALSAPLLHAHLDGHHTAHHDGRAIHAHVGSHEASRSHTATTAIEENDSERALTLSVFLAVASPSFDPHALPATPLLVIARPESAMPRPPQVVHGHDPPVTGSLSSRAPPAFLS